MPGGEHDAFTFRRRITYGDLMHVCEPGEATTIEQRERRPMLSAIPQRAAGGSDVIRKRLRPDVEIPDMGGCGEISGERVCTALSSQTRQIESQQADDHRAGGPDEES